MLGRRAHGGDLVARDELVRWHWPFAIYLAGSYGRCCRCREDDLFQAALLGLIRGADAWDPDRYPGRQFLTLARYHVRAAILDYLYGRPLIWIPHSARPTEIAHHPVGAVKLRWQQYRAWTESAVARAAKVVQGHDQELNYPDPSQGNLEVDESHAKDLEQLRLGLETLPPWHAEVLRRHFGLGGQPQETVRAIAREAGVSTQTVYAAQKAALHRLRKIVAAS